MRKRHNVAQAVGDSAQRRVARWAAGLAILAQLAFSLAGCIRDGGPHPEPPAPLGPDQQDAGRMEDVDSAGSGGGGGVGAGTGGAGGTGGSGGAGGEDEMPTGDDLDAGLDADLDGEDAGPLR